MPHVDSKGTLEFSPMSDAASAGGLAPSRSQMSDVTSTGGLAPNRSQTACANCMRSTAGLVAALLMACILVLGGASRAALADDELRDVQLRVSGSDGLIVLVVARYFDDSQVVSTVTERLELGRRGATLYVDANFSGVRLFVVVPTARKFTAALFQDGQAVAQQASEAIGVLSLSRGSTADDSQFEVPRALPNAPEQQFIQSFLAAIKTAATKPIVSELDVANVEPQTLDAYALALSRNLGDFLPDVLQLDGWLTWDGVLGTRVMSGTVRFERGSCRFKLMVIDNRLVDVEVLSDEMPDDWFHGPASDEAYISTSARLAALLFAGDASAARMQFSRLYHDEVTVESMSSLSQTLREKLGESVTQSTLKKTLLSGWDEKQQSKTLSVIHTVQLDGGNECVSKVDFVFPCGDNVVAKGHLATIAIRPTWKSNAPEQVELAHRALRALASDRPADFSQLLHPDIRPLWDAQEFARRHTLIASVIDGIAQQQPDWDLWSVISQAEQTRAIGEIPWDSGHAEAWIDFAEGHLVGVTLWGRDFSLSTLDCIQQQQSASRIGQLFWEHLLRKEFSQAHQMLAPEFREQLPAEPFKLLIQESGMLELGIPESYQVDSVRLADRIDRARPALIAVYSLAKFPGGIVQPLLLELQVDEHGQLSVLHLDTQFEARFPVDATAESQRLLSAFRNADVPRVLALAAAQDGENIDRWVLSGFLARLHKALGDFTVPPRASLSHEYAGGARLERLRAVIGEESDAVPVEIVTQYGNLKSFDFFTDQLADFVQEIADTTQAEQRVVEFLDRWLGGDQPRDLNSMLVEALQTDATGDKLAALRARLILQSGDYRSAQVVTLQPTTGENEISCLCSLEFSKETLQVSIRLALDAVSCRVSAVEIVR